jgi:hypothetical protein
MCAFMAKYQLFPFLICFISGSRSPSVFLVELGARDERRIHRGAGAQHHRRLYDDPTLYSVLQLVDGDQEALRNATMWNPKRKFLTFVEEIVLLINSGYINKETAMYMFGYYAAVAHRGENFRCGLAYSPEAWGLFMRFAEEAEDYLMTPDLQRITRLVYSARDLAGRLHVAPV